MSKTSDSVLNHQNNSEHQDRCNYSNPICHQNILEHGKNSLSPRLQHQGMVEKRNASTKVSRDSGCFDDTSLTTLAINDTTFPIRTSPTASDRSSHSAGLASHTDESGIHNMNEDCFFEDEENEKSSGTYKEKQLLKTRNILSDSKQKSSYVPQYQQVEKSPLTKRRSSNIALKKGDDNPIQRHPEWDKEISRIKIESSGDGVNNSDDMSNKDGKYASLVGKYGRGSGSNIAERISESKFNSVRSIFEQKAKTNVPVSGVSENNKT